MKVLQDNDTKKFVLKFINEITKLDLIDISFCNIEELDIYGFYLINLTGITKNRMQKKVFVKKIVKGKIKESLFCICSLTYEKYFENNSKRKNDNILKKISILEKKDIMHVNKVSVNLFKENLEKEKNNVEIYFIEMSKIIKYVKKNNFNERSKYIDFNQNDILILGVEN